jgi:hypothetical protein
MSRVQANLLLRFTQCCVKGITIYVIQLSPWECDLATVMFVILMFRATDEKDTPFTLFAKKRYQY